MGGLKLEVGHTTEIGRRRRNEDSLAVYLADPPEVGDPEPAWDALLLVADGMGGQRGGDRASRLAIQRLRQWLGNGNSPPWPEGAGPRPLEEALRRAIRDLNDEIYRLGQDDPEVQGLGTTLVLAVLAGGKVTVAHVGDSRCYRVHGSLLERLTVDHTWVAQQVEAGFLSSAEAGAHPLRNVLTRSLGEPQPPEPGLRTETLFPGDLLILCSDGLTGGLGDRDILQLARQEPSPQALVEKLTALANERDGSDNISVIAARILATPAIVGDETDETRPFTLSDDEDTHPMWIRDGRDRS